jgi:hypothetical protein
MAATPALSALLASVGGGPFSGKICTAVTLSNSCVRSSIIMMR